MGDDERVRVGALRLHAPPPPELALPPASEWAIQTMASGPDGASDTGPVASTVNPSQVLWYRKHDPMERYSGEPLPFSSQQIAITPNHKSIFVFIPVTALQPGAQSLAQLNWATDNIQSLHDVIVLFAFLNQRFLEQHLKAIELRERRHQFAVGIIKPTAENADDEEEEHNAMFFSKPILTWTTIADKRHFASQPYADCDPILIAQRVRETPDAAVGYLLGLSYEEPEMRRPPEPSDMNEVAFNGQSVLEAVEATAAAPIPILCETESVPMLTLPALEEVDIDTATDPAAPAPQSQPLSQPLSPPLSQPLSQLELEQEAEPVPMTIDPPPAARSPSPSLSLLSSPLSSPVPASDAEMPVRCRSDEHLGVRRVGRVLSELFETNEHLASGGRGRGRRGGRGTGRGNSTRGGSSRPVARGGGSGRGGGAGCGRGNIGPGAAPNISRATECSLNGNPLPSAQAVVENYFPNCRMFLTALKKYAQHWLAGEYVDLEESSFTNASLCYIDDPSFPLCLTDLFSLGKVLAAHGSNAAHIQANLDYYYDLRFRKHPVDARGALRFPVPACTTLIPPEDFLLDNLYKYAFPHVHDIITQSHPRVVAHTERMLKARFHSQLRAAQQVLCRLTLESGYRKLEEDSQHLAFLRLQSTAESDGDVGALLALANSYDSSASVTESTSDAPISAAAPVPVPAPAPAPDPDAVPVPVPDPVAATVPVAMNDELLGAPAALEMERVCRNDADRVFVRTIAREQAVVNARGQCMGDPNCPLHQEHVKSAVRRLHQLLRALHLHDVSELGTTEQIRQLSSTDDPTNRNPRIQLAKLVHAVHASIPVYAREITQMSAAPVTQDRAELTPKELLRRNTARRQRIANLVKTQRNLLQTALDAKVAKLRARVQLDTPPRVTDFEKKPRIDNRNSSAAPSPRSSDSRSNQHAQCHLLLTPRRRKLHQQMTNTFGGGSDRTGSSTGLSESNDELGTARETQGHHDDSSAELLFPELDWQASSVEQRQAAVDEQETKWKAEMEEKVERMNASLMIRFKDHGLREFMVMVHTGRYPLSFQSVVEWMRTHSSLAELRKRQLRTQVDAEEKAQRIAAQAGAPVSTTTAAPAADDSPAPLDELDDYSLTMTASSNCNGSGASNGTGSTSKKFTARQQLEQLRNPFSFIRRRKYVNLSFFGEMVANMLLSCEFYWRICHNHGIFLMLWFGAKDAMLAASTHENFILLGDAAKGKSFMLKLLEHLSLKHGTSLVGRLSRFANSSEDDPIRPTRKGVVEMHEEAGVTFLNMQQDRRTTSHSMSTALATGERSSKRCDLPSEQVQALLNEMTSSENTTRRLMFDPNINNFVQQVVTVETQKVYIFCANARPNQLYEPLASRCHVVQVSSSDRQNADIPGKQSESELTATFRAKRDKERMRWHRDYAFTYLICMLIDCGIFAPVSLDNAEMLFRMVLLKLKQMGVAVDEETRTNIRMKRFAALVTINRAVRAYCDMPESPFAQSSSEFAFDQLLPLEAALVCTQEEAMYSMTNFADCFENENSFYVGREIWMLMTENGKVPPFEFEPCSACEEKLAQDHRLYASRSLQPCPDCNPHVYYSTIGFTNFDDVKSSTSGSTAHNSDVTNGTACDVIFKQLHTNLRNVMSVQELRDSLTDLAIRHEYASDDVRQAVKQKCREMRQANHPATHSKRPHPASQDDTVTSEKRARQEVHTSVSSSDSPAAGQQRHSSRGPVSSVASSSETDSLWNDEESPLDSELRERAEKDEDERNEEKALNDLALEGKAGTTMHNIKKQRYPLVRFSQLRQNLFTISMSKRYHTHLSKYPMFRAIKDVCQHMYTEPGEWITGRTHRSQPYIYRKLGIRRDENKVLRVSSTNFASETQRFVLADIADQREGNMADAFTASPTITITENMDDSAAERRRKEIGFTHEMIEQAKVVTPKQLRDIHAQGTAAFEQAKADLTQRVAAGELNVERAVLPGDDESVIEVKRKLEFNRLLQEHYGDHLLIDYPKGITGWDTVVQSGYQRVQDAEADGFQFTLPLSDDENEEESCTSEPSLPETAANNIPPTLPV